MLLFHLATSVSHQASFPVVGHLCIIVFGETVCPGFSLVLTWVVFVIVGVPYVFQILDPHQIDFL